MKQLNTDNHITKYQVLSIQFDTEYFALIPTDKYD